jgi:hypothetical protein
MLTRFCNHLSKMWKPTRIDLVPLRLFSKFSVFILVFLLAFSLPVGAQFMNQWQLPPPNPQPLPQFTLPTTNSGWSESKPSESKATAVNQAFLQRISSKTWFLYIIIAGLIFNFLCLAALTWWTYQRLVTLKRKNERLNSDFSKIKTALQQVTGQVNNHAQSLINAKSDASELHDKLTNHGKKISNLNTQLELQEDRFLRFQDVYNTSKHDYLPHSTPDSLFIQKTSLTPEEKPLVDPADSITVDYQDAFYRGDRSVLRRLMSEELNITQDSEDALMKSSSLPTKLEVVKTGGSYLLIQRDGRHWLVPEFQILTSFTTSQLAKGIFSYAKENISTAELRRPAEVRDVGSLWEVVTMGVIAVPA